MNKANLVSADMKAIFDGLVAAGECPHGEDTQPECAKCREEGIYTGMKKRYQVIIEFEIDEDVNHDMDKNQLENDLEFQLDTLPWDDFEYSITSVEEV